MIVRIVRYFGRFLRSAFIAIGALVFSGGVIAIADYALTQGSGTTFASLVVAAKHYAAYVLCDATAGESQCAAVSSAGAVSVAASALPLPTGAATSALQTTGNTALTTINTTLGNPFQAGGALAANQSVNTAQVNGVTTLTGTGAVGTGAQRVAVGTDTATIAGSAPGTAGSASANVISVQGIASMTPFLANPGTAANWGVGATGSAVPANAIYNGVNAVSSEPAKATTGNLTGVYADLSGKVVTSPFANRENGLSCAVTLTASTSATTCTGMGAQGANVKIYITDLTCTRSDAGTTSATMTLDDAATTIIDMPNNGGGGGFSHTYNVPLVVAANTAFTVQSGTSLSSVHCSASGFKGY
jgi:hypothetical protein